VNGWRLLLTIKNWVLPIILGLMIGLIPVSAEETKLFDYELILVTDDVWGIDEQRVDGFKVKINGMDMYKFYGCDVWTERSTCDIIIMLQNEKIISQNDRMIEQFDIMIAQNKKMLDMATVEEFNDWLS